MFVADKATEEFWEGKPQITAGQKDLLHCYYSARRDSRPNEKVTKKELAESLAHSNYEIDIAVSILQKLDDHYLKLCADKLKRGRPNG